MWLDNNLLTSNCMSWRFHEVHFLLWAIKFLAMFQEGPLYIDFLTAVQKEYSSGRAQYTCLNQSSVNIQCHCLFLNRRKADIDWKRVADHKYLSFLRKLHFGSSSKVMGLDWEVYTNWINNKIKQIPTILWQIVLKATLRVWLGLEM